MQSTYKPCLTPPISHTHAPCCSRKRETILFFNAAKHRRRVWWRCEGGRLFRQCACVRITKPRCARNVSIDRLTKNGEVKQKTAHHMDQNGDHYADQNGDVLDQNGSAFSAASDFSVVCWIDTGRLWPILILASRFALWFLVPPCR